MSLEIIKLISFITLPIQLESFRVTEATVESFPLFGIDLPGFTISVISLESIVYLEEI